MNKYTKVCASKIFDDAGNERIDNMKFCICRNNIVINGEKMFVEIVVDDKHVGFYRSPSCFLTKEFLQQ